MYGCGAVWNNPMFFAQICYEFNMAPNQTAKNVAEGT